MTTPFSPPGGGLGPLYFRLYHGEVMRQALQQARDGVLSPQWRENVGRSGALSGLQSSDPYDVRESVVTAINEMPVCAWEPGHSPGWRAALDSWFDAARGALAEHRAVNLEQHANAAKLGASMATAARFAARSIAHAMAQLADNDALNDDTAQKSLSTFIVQRDTLTASYRAALSGAGEDVDWRAWFEERINNWDNKLAANGARTLLHQQHPLIERLPSYW